MGERCSSYQCESIIDSDTDLPNSRPSAFTISRVIVKVSLILKVLRDECKVRVV